MINNDNEFNYSVPYIHFKIVRKRLGNGDVVSVPSRALEGAAP